MKTPNNAFYYSRCRYQPSPDEVAASCDVTFAMLADPESAVRMFLLIVSFFFFGQLMFLVANLLDMHGNLLLLYVRWMLHVGSMELQVEWVLEKGTSSLFCSLMNIMFTIFAISTLKTIPQASNFSRRNCFHFAYLFITYN